MKNLLLIIAGCVSVVASDTKSAAVFKYENTVTITNGTEYLKLTPTNWLDSMVPANGFKVGASAPAWGNFTDANIQVLRFSKSADDLIYGSVQLNHNYKEGTTVHPHIHVWFPIAAIATASTNVWRLDYSWANIGAAFPGSTTIYVTNSGAVTQYEHRMIEFPEITGSGKTVSSIMAVTVTRVGTDAYDVYDDVIAMLNFDLHYQVDTIGSTQELTK